MQTPSIQEESLPYARQVKPRPLHWVWVYAAKTLGVLIITLDLLFVGTYGFFLYLRGTPPSPDKMFLLIPALQIIYSGAAITVLALLGVLIAPSAAQLDLLDRPARGLRRLKRVFWVNLAGAPLLCIMMMPLGYLARALFVT